MNTTSKAAVQSIGVMGPALAVLILLLNRFVFKSDVVTEGDINGTIDVVATVTGLITGIIGRWKATAPITGLIAPAPQVP